MKKFIPLILALLAFSCAKDPLDCASISEEPVVSKSQAIATTPNSYVVSLKDAERFSKSMRPKCDCCKVEPYIIGKDTLLYLVSYEKGWAIIAGDKRINPIIAKSDNESISSISSNDNLMTWIDSYADEILAIRYDLSETDNEYTKLWSKVSPISTETQKQTKSSVEYKWAVVSYTYCDYESSSELVPHLISTKWGQGYPWNTKLPQDSSDNNQRCPTGCSAVALSQIIYYMHYHLGKPTALYHNISIGSTSISGPTRNIGFSRSNFQTTSSRWNGMALNASGLGNASYVGDLMLDLGNRLGMKYSGSGSSADISTAAMSYYSLSYSHASYNYSLVKNDLLNSKPVNVVAFRNVTGSIVRAGHSWVIDGIGILTQHYVTRKHFEYTENWMCESEYYNTFDEIRDRYHVISEYDFVEEEVGSFSSEYLLMNWGYDGDNDSGYFGTYPSSTWAYNDRYYIYDKVINYDFR